MESKLKSTPKKRQGHEFELRSSVNVSIDGKEVEGVSRRLDARRKSEVQTITVAWNGGESRACD